MENVGESEISPRTMHSESDESKEIRALKGLRIFSYENQLGKKINPDGIETKYSDAADSLHDRNMKLDDENLKDDKVSTDFTVTDTTNGKDLANSNTFWIEDKIKDISKDVGLGWYVKEAKNKRFHESKAKDKHDEENKDKDEAEHQHDKENTVSVEMANSYRGSFSKGSDLDEITVEEEVDQISNDKRNKDDSKMINLNPRYLEFSEEQSREQAEPNIQRSNVFRKIKDDIIEPQNKYFHSKEADFAHVGYSIINEDDGLKGADKYVRNEDLSESEQISENEENGYLKNMTNRKYDEKAENAKVSDDTLYDSVKEEDGKESVALSGDMYLTTSIVTEQIEETNLENISPYEKPYIIPPFSKELGIVKQINYTNEGNYTYNSENDRDLSSKSILGKMNKEDKDIDTYDNNLLVSPLKAIKEEKIPITQPYQDETKDESKPFVIDILQGKTNPGKGEIIMESINATEFETKKEQVVEDKNQVLQENDYLKKTSGMTNKNSEEPIEIETPAPIANQNIGVQPEFGQHIGLQQENIGESTIRGVDFAPLDEHEHEKRIELQSVSDQSHDNLEYENEGIGVHPENDVYTEPKYTLEKSSEESDKGASLVDLEEAEKESYEYNANDNVKSHTEYKQDNKMESEESNHDYESISEEGINKFDKNNVINIKYKSNALTRVNEQDDDNSDGESYTEYDREKQVEKEKINQDQKISSEEETNSIDRYKVSDSDYVFKATPREYDQEDNDVESHTEYEHEKKIKSEQIHPDNENKSEEEINQIDKYKESHSDYETDTSTILDDKDDISQNLLESNDESDKDDYIDYSYAEVATHKKPSGKDSRVEYYRLY